MPNLAQVDAKQYGYRDDMPMTSKQVSIILGLRRKSVTNAIGSGKLEGTRVGQGGYPKKRNYNNETTWGYVKEWRKEMGKPIDDLGKPIDEVGLYLIKVYEAILSAKPSRKANG
mgnify:FL=1